MYKFTNFLMIFATIISLAFPVETPVEEVQPTLDISNIIIEEIPEIPTYDDLTEDIYIEPVVLEETLQIEEEALQRVNSVSDEDIYALALVTLAEAEGESEEGKRLVIDTVLNRVDNEHFPDSIHDVIYQKCQFSAMWGDRINRIEVTEDICELVREELASRTNYDVIFFNAQKYCNYGSELFVVGNHYFSSYV